MSASFRPLPRFAALLILSGLGAWYSQHFDIRKLAEMDSMTADQFVAHERAIHHHGVVTHFVAVLIMGFGCLAAYELLVFLIDRQAPKTASNDPRDPTPLAQIR